jgi:hypothetical protein
MLSRLHLMSAVALALLAASGGEAQRSPVAIEQISPRPAATAAVRIAPVRSGKSSRAVTETPREGGARVSVAPEIVEACRKAQAEDRPAPDGIDCLAVAQTLAKQSTQLTAEAALLPLFGQQGDVTGAQTAQAGSSVNADAVARQLSTGDVQASTGNGAAAIVGRERDAPAPNNPR